ncbi:unnamed protein product [Meganyctiphanes norvegica]|uniref:Lipocalin/cytosolic fatty-acid binding domain-containing protein n=1 Tax=Meganyctiphanes norvegica TaxID=48144 RepID=A0AAV2PXF4_MEGNR
MISVAVVLGSVLSFVNSQAITPGPCPEFTPMTNFTAESYLGFWYEIHRFPVPYQINSICNYAEYTDKGNGTIGVHNSGLVNGEEDEIFGEAYATEIPGHLILHFDIVPVDGEYNVLHTDYETYTTVYTCGKFFTQKIETAWILARKPELTPEEYEEALGQYHKWGIDTSHFIDTVQDENLCIFPPKK